MTTPLTLTEKMCHERALGHLPDFDASAEGEVMIMGHPVQRIDAWGGAALRCLIEYQARYLQRRTILTPCSDTEVWERLHGLVRDDAPPHLVLPNDTPQPKSPAPASVLLSARPVAALDQASTMASKLLAAADEELKEPARFAAKYLPEFIQNSLLHSERGPVPPIACSYHDAEEGQIQLVVIDVGAPRARDKKTLEQRVLSSDSSSLASLVRAGKDSFNIKLELIAGKERVRWTGTSRTSSSKGDPFSCFCTALTVSEK